MNWLKKFFENGHAAFDNGRQSKAAEDANVEKIQRLEAKLVRVDFVRDWSDKTELPACRLLNWIGLPTSKFHDWKQRFGKVNEHNARIPRDHGSPTTNKTASAPSPAPIPPTAIAGSPS